MFSIKKSYKIQVFHKKFGNPNSKQIENSVNKIRSNDVSTYLQHFTSQHVNQIIDNPSLFDDELASLGVIELKQFFIMYPSAWSDLKRKIHAYRSSDGNHFFIKKTNEEYILPTFLRFGIANSINSKDIEHIIRKEIFSNSLLIKQLSQEPSLLDSSFGDLSFLNKTTLSEKTKFVKKMIEFGIVSNAASKEIISNTIAIEGAFKELLPNMLKYLESIFNISFDDLPKTINIHTVSSYIAKGIWEQASAVHGGFEAKKKWILAKSFSAWGSYREIESIRKRGVEQIKKLPAKFEENGITISKVTSKIEINGGNEEIQIFSGMVRIRLNNGVIFDCSIEYRLKNIRSILLKMWENEDYNTIDAMRDLIGVAIIWPDEVSPSTKIEVIKKFSQVMSDKKYLLKNKGLLSSIKIGSEKSDIQKLSDSMKSMSNKPLGGVVSNKRGKTDEHFQNISTSGFAEIDNELVGFEVQFFDRSKYDFWKKDHYTYDPLKIISAWSRGSWFLTPHQVIFCIQREIPEKIRNDVIQKRPQEILYEYLKKGKLIAYIGNDDEIYITPKDHDDRFIEKFHPSIRKLHIQRPNHKDLIPTGGKEERVDTLKEYILKSLETYRL